MKTPSFKLLYESGQWSPQAEFFHVGWHDEHFYYVYVGKTQLLYKYKWVRSDWSNGYFSFFGPYNMLPDFKEVV